MADWIRPRVTKEAVAVVLAVGLVVAINALSVAILWEAITDPANVGISENSTQILTGAFGGIIGILGSYVGYSAARPLTKGSDDDETTELPPNVSFGKVTGRLVYVDPDTADDDSDPDATPYAGTVTFTARPPYLLDPTADPPTTLIPRPYVATLDAAGDLVDGNGNPGVYLVAGNDPDLNPVGWTYHAEIRGADFVVFREFDFILEAGASST